MEGLDLDNILSEDQMDTLFGEPEEETQEEENESEQEEDNEKENKKTTEVDPDRMFEDKPESVGSDDEGDEEDTASNEDGSSPDFFSSIANAFAEEGIFPDLDEETIKNIKTPADFRKAIDAQIEASLDEQQKRIKEALDYNVPVDKIKEKENIIAALNNISDDQISAEDEQGEDFRRRVIYQDYLNRGFNQDRAKRETERSFTAGSDIEDAREALNSIIEFHKADYKNMVEEAKAVTKQYEEEAKKRSEKIKDTIFNNKNKFFDNAALDDKIKQKAYDAIYKPIWKDPQTGRYLNAIQKLEYDNSEEYAANLGLIYALTDGFKSFDGLLKGKIKKEVKKGFSELERKINNSSRDMNGNLRFTSGVSDTDSYFGKGMKLDL